MTALSVASIRDLPGDDLAVTYAVDAGDDLAHRTHTFEHLTRAHLCVLAAQLLVAELSREVVLWDRVKSRAMAIVNIAETLP